MHEDKMRELKTRLREIDDLRAAGSLLAWDQMTCLPPGGAAARGRHLATLARLAHERLIAPEIGNLLEDLVPYAAGLPYDSDDAALIRLVRREYDRAVRVPPEFLEQVNAHTTETYDAWTKARPADDFAAVAPLLRRTLELSREFAGFFPGYEHIADPLIAEADYGMAVSTLRPLFAELRRELVPLAQSLSARPPVDDSCLHLDFPEGEQIEFAREVVKQLGYDFDRGRQDLSPHPFTIRISLGDVRITTHARADDLGDAFFSMIHESGHAMYEQGIDPALAGTPLASGASSGVHESQSRLWENMVCRSLDFWRYFYPRLRKVFPAQLGSVPLETFHRAVNKVQRSLIRTDADELTYNLHVMIRFDLELAMLEGDLAVADLPGAWRERYRADLGIAPSDDRDGVLQDVHWFGGLIGGAFQGYTLGNVMAAQFYAAALRAHPEIPAEIGRGNFQPLRCWLTEHIYRHGSKFTAAELIERATGGPLGTGPYLAYLRDKYQELYA